MDEQSTPLTPQRAAHLLRFTGATVHSLVSMAPTDILTWRPDSKEWCVNEVLGHLIEAERRGFAGRIRVILAEQDPQLEGWDQEEVARSRGDRERDPGELLAEFQGLRDSSVELVAGLKEADLDRGGHHPRVGYLRVRDLLHEWTYHDQNHLRQMLANLQGYVWPHMGNTQRFY